MAIGKLPDGDDSPDDSESLFAEINITPLTDVFLVLLVIFMVSAFVVKKQQDQKRKEQQQEEVAQVKKSGIRINLPSGPSSQEIDTQSTSLEVTITIDGKILVGGKQLAGNDVDRLFQTAFARDKNTQIVINADKGVQHGVVVNVMTRAKTVGLTKIAVLVASGG
jgi:biopolymer transport protein ExbD